MGQITAINGVPFSSSVLRKAVADAKTSTAPIIFTTLLEGESTERRIDYHKAELYPWIVRDERVPDLFLDILKPRRAAPSTTGVSSN